MLAAGGPRVRPALLVIDMQRAFLDGVATTPPLATTVEIIDHVAGLFRAADRPVVFVHDVESHRPGSPGYELVDGLHAHESDVTLDKLHGDALRETPLTDILAERGVDFVLVAGYKAENCVLATIKGLEARDLPHAVLRSGILSTSPDAAGFIERISPILSYEVVRVLLDAAGPP
jgi:nicotinamidase-related amidase